MRNKRTNGISSGCAANDSLAEHFDHGSINVIRMLWWAGGKGMGACFVTAYIRQSKTDVRVCSITA
jgi:hypothetical protein